MRRRARWAVYLLPRDCALGNRSCEWLVGVGRLYAAIVCGAADARRWRLLYSRERAQHVRWSKLEEGERKSLGYDLDVCGASGSCFEHAGTRVSEYFRFFSSRTRMLTGIGIVFAGRTCIHACVLSPPLLTQHPRWAHNQKRQLSFVPTSPSTSGGHLPGLVRAPIFPGHARTLARRLANATHQSRGGPWSPGKAIQPHRPHR